MSIQTIRMLTIIIRINILKILMLENISDILESIFPGIKVLAGYIR